MQFDSLLNRFGKSTDSEELLLALVIGSESVHSAVWQKNPTGARIIALGSLEEWSKDEELTPAADRSISTALEGLSHEPNQVVLGLPESWVEEDSITPAKKVIIKNLSEALSLKPIGFVVTTEAVVNFLKTKEGTPITAIILQLSSEEVVVSLVKIGKIIGSHTVGRSDDLGSDVEEGLARFEKSDPFPSRMILYDGHLDLESERQTLLSYAWQEKLSFLHIPKIEIIDKDSPPRAVVVASDTEAIDTTPAAVTQTSQEVKNLEAHGFYQDQDILEKAPSVAAPAPPPPPPPRLAEASSEGGPKPEAQQLTSDVTVEDLPPSFATRMIAHLSTLTNVFRRRPGTTLTTKKINPRLLLGLGLVFALIVLLIFIYWTVPKASITLYLQPREIKQDIDFTVDAREPTDVAEGRIHGERVEVEVEGQKETSTSGETLVGDKAKGTVEIFNKTNSLKKFPAGTVLIGPNEIEFELNNDVEVASQSATDTGITFGKEEVATTAAAVGSDANVSQGALFEVEGFGTSTYSARATTNFEGGSSHSVKSVSKEDQEKLQADLTAELTQKALEELKSRGANDETILSAEYEAEEVDKEFTKAVDEEADTLGLTLRLRLTTFKVKVPDVLLLVKGEETETTGYTPIASASEIDVTSADIDESGGKVAATLTTKLVPKIDELALKNHLKGKYLEETKSFLKSIPSFSRVEITLSPKLPKPLATFPHRTQNITLNIEVETTD